VLHSRARAFQQNIEPIVSKPSDRLLKKTCSASVLRWRRHAFALNSPKLGGDQRGRHPLFQRPPHLAARFLAAALGIAAASGCSATPVGDATATLLHGDALYAQGKYHEAFVTYGAALKALQGKDQLLSIEAGRRAGRAFCMDQFAGARRDLAAGDRPMALLQIATALSDPACAEFKDEVRWAREQQRAYESKKPQ
jgi:hypothetical protein